ncbi:MAG: hypothetical protein IT186_03910 [Acidobacteria bacterium]|nr:hypothetical protein [Acidobacteriota bacterium]
MNARQITKQAETVKTLTQTVNALVAQATVKPSQGNLESLRRAAAALETERNRFNAMRLAAAR